MKYARTFLIFRNFVDQIYSEGPLAPDRGGGYTIRDNNNNHFAEKTGANVSRLKLSQIEKTGEIRESSNPRKI